MPFVREKFIIDSPQKATIFLQKTLQITQREAQKMIDKGRVENNGAVFREKAGFLRGEVVLSHFKAERGEYKPIFETPEFGAFDKPAKLLSHPKGRFSHSSLLDSIRFYFGKDANPINRLDSETSGILLVSKNKQSEIALKKLFMQKCVDKTYFAVVFGQINAEHLAQKFGENIIATNLNSQLRHCEGFARSNPNQRLNRLLRLAFGKSRNDRVDKFVIARERSDRSNPQKSNLDSQFLCFAKNDKNVDFIINFPLKEGQKGTDLGIRSHIDKNGKVAQTAIKILHYDSARNITHLKIMPLTGRTHQIRAHLAHIGHRIVGESLYGVSDENARDFLDGKINDSERVRIFGANRLMLHAQSLHFFYNDNEFFIKSKMNFAIDSQIATR